MNDCPAPCILLKYCWSTLFSFRTASTWQLSSRMFQRCCGCRKKRGRSHCTPVSPLVTSLLTSDSVTTSTAFERRRDFRLWSQSRCDAVSCRHSWGVCWRRLREMNRKLKKKTVLGMRRPENARLVQVPTINCCCTVMYRNVLHLLLFRKLHACNAPFFSMFLQHMQTKGCFLWHLHKHFSPRSKPSLRQDLWRLTTLMTYQLWQDWIVTMMTSLLVVLSLRAHLLLWTCHLCTVTRMTSTIKE